MLTYQPSNVLVTGGAGFMYEFFGNNFRKCLTLVSGSNMILHMLKKYPNYTIVNIDKMDICSSVWGINNINNSKYHFVKGDILCADLVMHLLSTFKIDSVIHFAASSYVDKSFENPTEFTKNNVLGTHTLLECCRRIKVSRFVFVSTDEVYGTMAYDNSCTESSAFSPTNPYAASKASTEVIIQTYIKCFKLPVIITRSNNIFGPRQFPEKLIPKFICRLKQGLPCCVHGDGSVKRGFIYIRDAIEAFDIILHKGVIGNVYNIEAKDEASVIQIAKKILSIFKLQDRVDFIKMVPDRPINDLRYCIDGSKLRQLGYNILTSLDEGLSETVKWYMENDPKLVWSCFASSNSNFE